MLHTQIKADTVENWGTPILNKENIKPMTDEQSSAFINLCLADDEAISQSMEKILKDKLVSIFISRSSRVFKNLKIDIKIVLFFAMIYGSPGTICMWIYILACGAKKLGVKEITWEIFGTKLFPMGIPNEDTLHEFWDMQKVRRGEEDVDSLTYAGDNAIDYGYASKSLIDFFNDGETEEPSKIM